MGVTRVEERLTPRHLGLSGHPLEVLDRLPHLHLSLVLADHRSAPAADELAALVEDAAVLGLNLVPPTIRRLEAEAPRELGSRRKNVGSRMDASLVWLSALLGSCKGHREAEKHARVLQVAVYQLLRRSGRTQAWTAAFRQEALVGRDRTRVELSRALKGWSGGINWSHGVRWPPRVRRIAFLGPGSVAAPEVQSSGPLGNRELNHPTAGSRSGNAEGQAPPSHILLQTKSQPWGTR